MRWRHSGLAAIVAIGWASAASAQQLATTVQLPTFHVFTVNTTVSVPDSGGAYLGGFGRRATGLRSLGPPFAQARPWVGVESQAMGARVTASIIDLDQLDRLVLGQAAGTATRAATPEEEFAERVAAAQQDSPQQSVAAVRRQQEAAAEARQQEGRAQLDRAAQAEAEGKLGAARVYYRMAARRLTGELRDQALRHLALLSGGKQAAQVAAATEAP